MKKAMQLLQGVWSSMLFGIFVIGFGSGDLEIKGIEDAVLGIIIVTLLLFIAVYNFVLLFKETP